MERSSWFKLAAFTLSILYFVTNCALAHAPEANFWAERRKMARLPSAYPLADAAHVLNELPALQHPTAVPALSESIAEHLPTGFADKHADVLSALSPAYGTVRRIVAPKGTSSSRLIVYIQDVHMNADAQKNIGRTVESLIEKKSAGLVALEGSFAPIDLERYRAFPDHDVIRHVADYLLRENKISGPVHTAFTSSQELPPFLGIDDHKHYDSNVDAFRRSSPLIEGYKNRLAERRADLARRKNAVFSPSLRAYDDNLQAYREGRISLGDYVKTLAGAVPDKDLPPALRGFIEALEMESFLDFKQVETERARLVQGLTERLSKDQIALLLNQSIAYRLGRIRYADFYRSLRDLCGESGVSLAQFKAMDAYIRYVLVADRLEPEKILGEMSVLEKAGYTRLAATAEEKQLVEESSRLQLSGKLIDFSLTPEEWKEYVAATHRPGLSDGIGDKSTSKFDLSSFEAFYREADARDQAMTDNLLRAMDERRIDHAVLVTGGYHSPGVTERLARAGVAVVSFVPKIEKINTPQGSAYLSVFMQEKTPLEKLFQGEKLFLAQDPLASEVQRGDIPVLAVAYAVRLGIAQKIRNELPVGAKSDAETIFEWLGASDRSRFSFESGDDIHAERLGKDKVAVTVTIGGRTVTSVVTFTVSGDIDKVSDSVGNPVTVGVIGMGRHMQKSILPALLEAARRYLDPAFIIGVARSTYDQVRSRFPDSPLFQLRHGEAEVILRDKSVHAVVIAARDPDHYRLIKKALTAGKDVLVENPFVLKHREAKELVALAERKGRVLIVGQMIFYSPVFARLEKIMKSGELGPIREVEGTFLNSPRDGWKPGNVVEDLGHHLIYAVQRILGQNDYKSLAYANYDPATDSADFGLVYTVGDHDVTAKMKVSTKHGDVGDPDDRTITVVGEQFTAKFTYLNDSYRLEIEPTGRSWDPAELARLKRLAAPPAPGQGAVEDRKQAFGLEMDAFLEAIHTRGATVSSGRSAVGVVRAIEEIASLIDQHGRSTDGRTLTQGESVSPKSGVGKIPALAAVAAVVWISATVLGFTLGGVLFGTFMDLFLAVLFVDFVLNARKGEVSLKRAGVTLGILLLAVAVYGVVIGANMGWGPAGDFFAVFGNEQILSLDNLFAFLIVLTRYDVPKKDQPNTLRLGIIIAMGLRVAFILMGVTFITHFDWALVLLAVFLFSAGYSTIKKQDDDLPENWAIKGLKKILPGKFVKKALPILAIGIYDIIFALDSLPVGLSISKVFLIVATANLFAVVALTASYVFLKGLHEKFKYMKQGVGTILIFIGAKLFMEYVAGKWGLSFLLIPTWLSMVIIGVILTAAVVVSWRPKWFGISTAEDRVARDIVNAVYSVRAGERPKASIAIAHILAQPWAAEKMEAGSLQDLLGLNPERVRATTEGLDDDKLEEALKLEFRKRALASGEELSDVEVHWLVTQVVLSEFVPSSLNERLRHVRRDKKPFMGGIIDPSVEDPVKFVSDVLRQSGYLESDRPGSRDLSRTAVFIGDLTAVQKEQIEALSWEKLVVHVIANTDIVQSIPGTEHRRLNFAALDTVMKTAVSGHSFTSYRILIPETLLGGLDDLAALQALRADESSILREFAFVLIDKDLRARPLMTLQSLENVIDLAQFIAKQA